MLAEHLVAIMLKAGRLKDFARVEMFLSQRQSIWTSFKI
jgi:hypothetical protein